MVHLGFNVVAMDVKRKRAGVGRYLLALIFILLVSAICYRYRSEIESAYYSYFPEALPDTWFLFVLIALILVLVCVNTLLKSWRIGSVEVLLLMVLSFALIGAFIGYVFGYIWQIDEYPLWQHTMLAMMGLGAIVSVVCLLIPDSSRATKGLMEVDRSNEPRLFRIMEGLCEKADCPMPSLYVSEANEFNAYAFGKYSKKRGIVVMRPLMELLDDDELEAVLGHELTHIMHRDVPLMVVASTCARTLCIFSLVMGILALISGLMIGASASASSSRRNNDGAGLVFLAILLIFIPVVIVGAVLYVSVPLAAVTMAPGLSRKREYGADEGSAMITGKPMKLASALMKMEAVYAKVGTDLKPGTTTDLMIANPFVRSKMKLKERLLSTHPTTEERVKRLEILDRKLNG